jgi:hypothetical protein
MDITGAALVPFLSGELQRKRLARNSRRLEQDQIRRRIGDARVFARLGETGRARKRDPAISGSRILHSDHERFSHGRGRLAPDMPASCNQTAFDQNAAPNKALCGFRPVDVDEACLYCFSHAE